MTTLTLYREAIGSPVFTADTARHLGLFAYNVAARYFPGQRHLVEEAVQEALTRACEHWPRAIRSGNTEAWIVNTTTNVCHEKLREEQRGARSSTDGRDAARSAGDDVVSRALLTGALRRLTTRQRLVVVWRYVFDRSVTQTAADLGLSESKVRDATHNAVKRLQRLLGEEWSET